MTKLLSLTAATLFVFWINLGSRQIPLDLGSVFVLMSLWILLHQDCIPANNCNRYVKLLAPILLNFGVIDIVMIYLWPLSRNLLAKLLLSTIFDAKCRKCLKMIPHVVNCLVLLNFANLLCKKIKNFNSVLDVSIVLAEKVMSCARGITPAQVAQEEPTVRRSPSPEKEQREPSQLPEFKVPASPAPRRPIRNQPAPCITICCLEPISEDESTQRATPNLRTTRATRRNQSPQSQ